MENSTTQYMQNPPQGIAIRKNKNKFVAVRIHYTAVPSFRSEEWLKHAKQGYLTEDAWEQEMEINFTLAGTSKVYPMFNYEKHVTKLSPIKELPLLVGWDFGYHHPAIAIAQIDTYDRLNVLDEDLGNDITIQNYGKYVKKYLRENYPYHYRNKLIQHFGDPAGNQQNDKSEFTSIQILRKLGFFIKWKRISIKQGIRIIQQLMMEREDKTTGFRIDPSCKIIIDGLRGGYVEDAPKNDKASKELPFEDDFYSHNLDCVRYLVVNKYPAHGIFFKNKRTIVPKTDFNPIGDDEIMTHKQSKFTGYWL